MNLSEASIKNPVMAWMLMIALMFFGWLCFKDMGIGQMPDVDFPVLTVSATWEGAAPAVMETDVVDILEDAVMGIEGLKSINSSARQGSAHVTLEFHLNRDIDAALQETQSKISEARSFLPKDMDPPIIQKFNPEDQPILWAAVSTEGSTRDLMELVDRKIKDQFKTVPGVSEVFLGGYVDPNLRVWIDTQKLAEYELSVDDVVKSIQSEHTEIPAGKIETKLKESNVRVMGEANQVKDFEQIMINYRGGQPLYRPVPLKEVATIEDGLADRRRISRTMSRPSVGLGIRKQRGQNSVRVAREVRKKIDEVRKNLPKGYAIGINFDSTRFIEDAVHELVFTLILSALLTSLVCWLFLGSWSSTVNILLAIPTSILGTFIILKFSNFTLNTFTLLGLSLAIGIVVDDAIMVLENIVRHRQLGESQLNAALKGSKEITLAAVVATTAIMAIFMPVAFMKGIIGKFFFQFGITISVAVFLSLFEALSFAPMRCSQFLEMHERKDRLGRAFEKYFAYLTRLYGVTLEKTLHYKKWVLIGSAVFFIASLCFIPLLKKEFVPAQDQSMFLARLQTPIGSSLEFTSEKFKEAEKITADRPEINRYMTMVGGFGGGEVNQGIMFFNLKQPHDRPRDSEKRKKLSQQELMDYFREKFNKVPELKAFFQDLSTRGFSAKRGYPIECSVLGPDWDQLANYSKVLREEMKKTGFFADIDSDFLEGMPEIRIYPDRQKAFERGISIRALADVVSTLVAGSRISKYTDDGRRYDVRIQVKPEKRQSVKDLESIYVRNNRGELVRLSDVVHFEEKTTLLTITRQGRERAISIFANPAKGKSQAKAIEELNKIAARVLPEDYHLVFSGTSETFKESFQSLGIALMLGIIISYMVLAAQFNHVIHPFTVLLALPFSISGAILALLVSSQSLNIFSFIGLLLLMGVVKKNSILLVEFTNQLRGRGEQPLEAILKACPIRFRPIIMTSVSTIAAAIPPALALGPGAETRIPMAIAVIGGMIVSTILTLYVVPCAYLLLVPCEKTETWKKLGHFFLTFVQRKIRKGPTGATTS